MNSDDFFTTDANQSSPSMGINNGQKEEEEKIIPCDFFINNDNHFLPSVDSTIKSSQEAEEEKYIKCKNTADTFYASLSNSSLTQLNSIGEQDYQKGLNYYYALNGLKIEKAKAFKAFSTAHSKGHTLASIRLGICYYEEEGILPIDENKGALLINQNLSQLIDIADQQKKPDALCLLGRLYYHGFGIPKNYMKAKTCFEQARVGGDIDAIFYLGLVYFNGLLNNFDVGNNLERAIEYFEEAAEKENVETLYSLGSIYHPGLGIWSDWDKSKSYYEKAAKKGHADSMTCLAHLYQNKGFGVLQYRSKIEFYYNEAEKTGDPVAIYNVGVLYEDTFSRIYNQDLEKATSYFQRAADKGHVEAKEKLHKHATTMTNNWSNRLKKNDPTLSALDLRYYQLTHVHIALIAQSLLNNTQVTTLNLKNNKLCIKSLYHVTRLLAKNKTIKTILLDTPEDEKSKRIFNFVITPHLKFRNKKKITCDVVDLHGCDAEMINDTFLSILPEFTNLIELNLSNIGLSISMGKEHYSSFLQKNTKLEELDLSFNKYDSDILLVLANLVRFYNKTLKKINLRNNRLYVINTGYHYNDYQSLLMRFQESLTLQKIKIDVSANWFEEKNYNYRTNDKREEYRNAFSKEIYLEPENGKFFKSNHLFFSDRASKNIVSMLNSDYRLSGEYTQSPQWVVSLVCRKGDFPGHSFILLEGIRRSGQRFVERYHLTDKKNYLCPDNSPARCSSNIAIISTGRFDLQKKKDDCFIKVKWLNKDHWTLNTFPITLKEGKKFRKKMLSKNGSIPNYDSIPQIKNAFLNLFKSEKKIENEKYYNCLTWAVEQLNSIDGVEIDLNTLLKSLLPSKAAEPPKPERKSILQWMSG